MSRLPQFPAAALMASLALASCAGNAVPGASAGNAVRGLSAVGGSLQAGGVAQLITDGKKKPKSKIQHVVIIMQENRSFDNLFQGYPGANTVASGLNSKGQLITLVPVPLESNYGIDHSSTDFFAACDGNPPGQNCKMDGFDKETAYSHEKVPANPEYGYVPTKESALYFQMAQAYVLADNMFTSHIDASFVSHQYIIAGQANSAVDLPTTDWGCGGNANDTVLTLNQDRSYGPAISPCFNSETLADEAEAQGLTWRYYATASSSPQDYPWSAFQAISHIYDGKLWNKNVINPPSQFLTDVENGHLANLTWITPTWANSDHATSLSNTGPQWVASLVNAVGESKFWKTTTIFIMWDEWGGWYDHVPPPYVDYDGLGMRVPLLMISPYAKLGYVTHVQYEHGSILRYIEDNFGLPQLAASDTRANDPAVDAFDYTQKARPFTPIKSQMKADDFIRQPPDPRAPDDD